MIPDLFSKQPIPEKLPHILQEKIDEFRKCVDREELLLKAFDFITRRWGGPRYLFFLKFNRVFWTDLEKICAVKGYHHCTTMNYLLRIMAVRSGLFRDEDIELKLTHTWFIAPHQYLEINLQKKEPLTLDPWNWQFGIPYGKYGKGFDSLRIWPKKDEVIP